MSDNSHHNEIIKKLEEKIENLKSYIQDLENQIKEANFGLELEKVEIKKRIEASLRSYKSKNINLALPAVNFKYPNEQEIEEFLLKIHNIKKD